MVLSKYPRLKEGMRDFRTTCATYRYGPVKCPYYNHWRNCRSRRRRQYERNLGGQHGGRKFTPREQQLLQILCEYCALTRRQVADMLGIDIETLDKLKRYLKLKIMDSRQASELKNGVVDII